MVIGEKLLERDLIERTIKKHLYYEIFNFSFTFFENKPRVLYLFEVFPFYNYDSTILTIALYKW